MATVPSFDTWLAGERPTAAKLNKNIRDAGNFLKATPFGWAYRNAALTLTDATWTEIAFDAEKADTDSMFSTSTGFTIVTPGWYSFRGGSRFPNNSAGYRGCRIRVNNIDADVVYSPPATSFSCTIRADADVYCNAGDTVTFGVYSNGAGSLSLLVAQPHYTFLRARWMSA